ncbi:TlpA family protein disulfide reductase [Moheibacter stercoris]|uniref:Thiol-disulfide isomerase/thioredoxin n=1 Tax=Moheibacter stercoris TaxID=1628251 RepID=A0ABV2LQS7_9FLAO
MKQIMKFLYKNKSNLLFFALILVLVFSTDAKALLSQGLMKLGFYQPKLEEAIAPKEVSSSLYFEMLDADGNSVELSDLKGKVVFINFWATWCPPCIAEMPSIQKMYDKVRDDEEIVVLTVEVQGAKEKAMKFMERKNMDLPVVYPNTAIPEEIFQGSLPTTVIFDKDGNIAHTTMGMADYSGQNILDFFEELKTK